MDVVLRTYGYVYEREGNIIRVTTKENLATEELITETFVMNYTTAAEAEPSKTRSTTSPSISRAVRSRCFTA